MLSLEFLFWSLPHLNLVFFTSINVHYLTNSRFTLKIIHSYSILYLLFHNKNVLMYPRSNVFLFSRKIRCQLTSFSSYFSLKFLLNRLSVKLHKKLNSRNHFSSNLELIFLTKKKYFILFNSRIHAHLLYKH